MIYIKGLSKYYEKVGGKQIILENVDFSLEKGDMAIITGRSGSGKTTLLKILALLEKPNGGSYTFFDKKIFPLKKKEKKEFRDQNMSFVFQDFKLIDRLNAFENIEMPLGYRGIKSKERKYMVEELAKELEIEDILSREVEKLSGGEKQRVAVARALITKPVLLLLDEPTANVDEENAILLLEILEKRQKENSTSIIIVSHDSLIIEKYNKKYKLEKASLKKMVKFMNNKS